ncbi:unnamed protein product [Ambrosiozyma monospora]|uniref:Unnamed protein product n=1 Tax=Ambrosiozyma monospora TaxID=43982 RepID=A0ACB5TKI9_AMBMO|nr:unnamed protein product [Ambrosiozyma monospora]
MESESGLVIPISRAGLLVLCAKHEYFYLTPNFKARSSDRGITTRRAFLRRAKLSHSDGLLEDFKSWCFINDHKLVLFNFHGESYALRIKYTLTTEESDIPIEGPIIETLLVEKWETQLIDEGAYSIPPSWLFKVGSKRFIGLTDFFRVCLFDFNTGPPVTTIHRGGQKPITCITEVQNHKITYGSGDISGSKIVYADNTYTVSHDGVLKKFIEIEHRSLGTLFVTLTESQNSRIDLNEVTSLNKIEVIDSNLNSITAYEFEDDVVCFDILNTQKLSFFNEDQFYLDPSELSNVSNKLSNSFIAISSSSDEDDTDSNEDTCELLFFHIDSEQNLSLETMAVINKPVNLLHQLNKNTLLLLGPNCLHWIAFSVFKVSGEVDIKFDLLHSSYNLPFSYPSSISSIPGSENIVLADAFNGVYVMKLSSIKQRICSIRLVSEKIVATSCAFFNKDGLLVGDILGNIFLFSVVIEDSINANLLSSFNLNRGAITSIKAVDEDVSSSVVEMASVDP